LVGHLPHGRCKTITFVAGLRHRAMVQLLPFDNDDEDDEAAN
jgi:hypothetical protein